MQKSLSPQSNIIHGDSPMSGDNIFFGLLYSNKFCNL